MTAFAIVFSQLPVSAICCKLIHHKTRPLNNYFCCFRQCCSTPASASICHISQAHASVIVFAVIRSYTSFPTPTFNFVEGWENTVFPCLFLGYFYERLTTRHFTTIAAVTLFALSFNKHCACMTFPPRLVLCVTSSWMVSQLKGWLCCDNIRLMLKPVVLGCHVLPFCSLTFLSLLCLDRTAVAHWGRQLAWPKSVTASHKLLIFSPPIAIHFSCLGAGKWGGSLS